MTYEMVMDIPYTLDAYDQVTLKERFDRELKSFLCDKRAEVIYLTKQD